MQRSNTGTLSNSAWTLRGYSLNVNGVNAVTKSTLKELSKRYHLIALQETKFTTPHRLKRANYLWSQASAFNTGFWSQNNCIDYTGRAGVGLLITPTCPIKNIQDITPQYASTQEILHRYLLLEGTVEGQKVYIHIIYAPVDPASRPSFSKHYQGCLTMEARTSFLVI